MKKLMLFFMVQALALSLAAQPVNMRIWPEGVPGAKKSADYVEKKLDSNDGIVRIEKVTEPEIIVYLPEKAKANGKAVLIIPGGGYGIIAIDHEGYAIAKWLNENGIAGIVLKYRLPSDIIMTDKSIGPLQDAQEALRIIRRNAVQWNIHPDRIGVMGFSAGGHLASTLSTQYGEQVYKVKDGISARPDFSILIYPVITFDASYGHPGTRKNLIGETPSDNLVKKYSGELQVNANTPPAFLIHSSDDKVVPVKNSLLYYEALQKNNVPAEMHIFKSGGHGYGLGRGNGTETTWATMCANWLQKL